MIYKVIYKIVWNKPSTISCRSLGQLSERLASLCIIGAQSMTLLKPLKHSDNNVQRRLRGLQFGTHYSEMHNGITITISGVHPSESFASFDIMGTQ